MFVLLVIVVVIVRWVPKKLTETINKKILWIAT
jgi:hypothetical protein